MRQRYRLYRRKKGGRYYIHDDVTGKQDSLHTTDRATALRLFHSRGDRHCCHRPVGRIAVLRNPELCQTQSGNGWLKSFMSILQSSGVARKFARKYLTFTLQGEAYGIDVLQVREIIRHAHVTGVPQMPKFTRGVINLRGKIIPVMDLRLRFELSARAKDEQTCIVVVQVTLPDGNATPMGLVVDGDEEVINLSDADIEETSNFGGQICTDLAKGVKRPSPVLTAQTRSSPAKGNSNGHHLDAPPPVRERQLTSPVQSVCRNAMSDQSNRRK